MEPEGCAQIEAAAMDMNTAFDLEISQHCLKAREVYDLFHVVIKYGREMINRVRVDETNRLHHDKPASPIGYQASPLVTAAQSREPEEAGTTGSSRGIMSRVRWPMHTGQLEGINIESWSSNEWRTATGTAILFHEVQERLSRKSVKYHFLPAKQRWWRDQYLGRADDQYIFMTPRRTIRSCACSLPTDATGFD